MAGSSHRRPLSLRLPPPARARLRALSVVINGSVSDILRRAVDCYYRARTETDRRLVDKLARTTPWLRARRRAGGGR